MLLVLLGTTLMSCGSTHHERTSRHNVDAFDEYLDRFAPFNPSDSTCLDCIAFEINTNDTSLQLGKRLLSPLVESVHPSFKTFPIFVVTCEQGYLAFLLHYYDSGLFSTTYIEAITYNNEGQIIDHHCFLTYYDYGGYTDADGFTDSYSLTIKDSMLSYCHNSLGPDNNQNEIDCHYKIQKDAILELIPNDR